MDWALRLNDEGLTPSDNPQGWDFTFCHLDFC